MTAAALAEARQIASERLVAWLRDSGVGLAEDPSEVTRILMSRDRGDARFQVLQSFAERWALDVVTVVTSALVPRRGQRLRTPDVIAVEAALETGASWAAIGGAIGVAGPTAHIRYKDRLTPGANDAPAVDA